MKIEAGKSYKTRDGRKVGPMQKGPWPRLLVCKNGLWNTSDGTNGDRYSKNPCIKRDPCLDLIAEWADEPRPWGELTDAEKGAMLVAWQSGGEIQFWNEPNESWFYFHCRNTSGWRDDTAYRIKPEPVVETREGTCRAYAYEHCSPSLCDTSIAGIVEGKWTAEVKDGVPQKITWEISHD